MFEHYKLIIYTVSIEHFKAGNRSRMPRKWASLSCAAMHEPTTCIRSSWQPCLAMPPFNFRNDLTEKQSSGRTFLHLSSSPNGETCRKNATGYDLGKVGQWVMIINTHTYFFFYLSLDMQCHKSLARD